MRHIIFGFAVLCIASFSILATGCSGDSGDGSGSENLGQGGSAGAAGAAGAGGSAGEGGAGGEAGETGAGGGAGEGVGRGMGGMGGGIDGVVDPDEGEPMELAPPAGLDEPFSPPNDNGSDCSATKINNFRGWLVDRIGRPTPGAFGQICILQAPSGACSDNSECASGQRCDGGQCATLVCLQPANTDDEGVFTVGVPAENNCVTSGVLRATRVGERRASMYCKTSLDDISEGNVTLRDPLFLYATLPPVDHPEYGDDMMARTVRFEDGLELNVRPWDLFGSDPMIDYEMLSARRVTPDERGLCFLEGVENAPSMLYAFAPEVAVDGDGATFGIPNELELAPGAQVEVSILGGLDCYLTEDGERTHVDEGEWRVLGTATVNGDGTLIESDEGVALPCLTWMGYRPI